MKQVANSLKIELASYRELQAFSQFGSDLDKETKDVLNHGAILMEVLKQNQYDTYPLDRQVIELFAAKHRFLENLKIEEVKPTLTKLYEFIKASHKEVIDEILTKKALSDELTEELKKIIKGFIETL
jgi:F-type H+-transporting ATPase subunit alpha